MYREKTDIWLRARAAWLLADNDGKLLMAAVRAVESILGKGCKVNSVTLIGNLGEDAEYKQTATGRSLCKLRVATTQKWLKDGDEQESTDWHNVTCWGKVAERTSDLRKGARVMVIGQLKTRSYETSDGEKKWVTEVNASDVGMVPRSQQSGSDSDGSGGRF